MIDYEKLQRELNDYASYLIESIKRDYGFFFSEKKQELLNQMIKDKHFVVIDSLVGGNVIHINPNHEIFKTGNYKSIKKYFQDNILVGELLRFFLTFSISEHEYGCLEQANLQQAFRIFLRNGFISFISKEFCVKNRLAIPEERYSDNLEFVEALENKFIGFSALKSLAFSKEYLYFVERFYEQTGEDILDFYQEFLASKQKEPEIELLEFEEESFTRSGR